MAQIVCGRKPSMRLFLIAQSSVILSASILGILRSIVASIFRAGSTLHAPQTTTSALWAQHR